MTIDRFIEQLAARTPTPGGGAAAAVSAAMGASLLGMVSQFTTGAKWADRDSDMTRHISVLTAAAKAAVVLKEQDETAYRAVRDAFALAKVSEEEKGVRRRAIEAATVDAAGPPAALYALCESLLPIAEDLRVRGNPSVVSDVAVAASLLRSALESSAVNISINASSLTAADEKRKLTAVYADLSSLAGRFDRVMTDILGGEA